MANDEHVALLKQGMTAWNAWRDENPDVLPNLSGADLIGADLAGRTSAMRTSSRQTSARRTSVRRSFVQAVMPPSAQSRG
jgi:hypothetical protein